MGGRGREERERERNPRWGEARSGCANGREDVQVGAPRRRGGLGPRWKLGAAVDGPGLELFGLSFCFRFVIV